MLDSTTFKKAVIIIIDALRDDFIVLMNHF